MKLEEIREYCESKNGAKVEYQTEWEALKGHIEGKMFVLIGTDKVGSPIVTVKCEPEMGESYRAQYKDIIPGYYMNKLHWNSIYYENRIVPDAIIKEMIDQSYKLILNSFSKKIQSKYID